MSHNPTARQYYRDERIKTITAFCKKYQLKLESKNHEYQYRIMDTLDVYPTSGKCFWIPLKEWSHFNSEEDLRNIILHYTQEEDKKHTSEVTGVPEVFKSPEAIHEEHVQAHVMLEEEINKNARLPKQRDEYWCIKNAFPCLVGTRQVGTEYEYINETFGLGSDDRMYIWRDGKWLPL